MSYGDSKAVFKRRCEEIGFESEVIEQISPIMDWTPWQNLHLHVTFHLEVRMRRP